MAFEDNDALGGDEENIENTYLSFHVADEEYAVHVSHVTEIVRIQKIFPVPDLPRHIRGVINLRGRVVPLLDVRARFGLREVDYSDRTVVIVLEYGDASTGLVVDAVHEVSEILPQDIEPVSVNAALRSGAIVTGMGKREGRVTFLVDVASLVNASTAAKAQSTAASATVNAH